MMIVLEELISPLEVLPDVGAPERVKLNGEKLIIHPEIVVMTDTNGNIISRYKDDIWRLKHAGARYDFSFKKFDIQSKESIKRLMLVIMMKSNKVLSELNNTKERREHFTSTRGLNTAKLAYKYGGYLRNLYNRNEQGSRNLEELLNDKEILRDCICKISLSSSKGLRQTLELVELVSDSVNIDFVLDEEVEALLLQRELEYQEKQHPVIPLPIYAEKFRQRWAHFEYIEPYTESLCAFIKRHATDPYYGRFEATLDDGTIVRTGTILFNTAIKQYRLEALFSKYHVTDGNKLKSFIAGLQHTCAYILNQLSGMRAGELQKLRHGCFVPASETKPPLLQGLTSKKYGGIERLQQWITHSDTRRIVVLLEKLSFSLLEGIILEKPDDIPLFIKPSYIRVKRRSVPIHYNHDIKIEFRQNTELALDNSEGKLTLTQELVDTYLKRTELTPEYWDIDGYKHIGKQWSSNFHQGRRTYAFLAINSGMVTASVLKEQLAHTSMLMAAYYGNGASNLEPLITDGENNIVNTINDIRDEQAMLTLHAHIMAGGRVDLKKEITDMDRDETDQIISDPSKLVYEMEDTRQAIKKGNASVRNILTGWCDKVGPCQSNLMLMFSDCEECEHRNDELDRIEMNLGVLERYIEERIADGKDINDLEIIDAQKKRDYLKRVKEKKLKEISHV